MPLYSILRATGLTDPNFNFHITDDGEFNYLTQNDKHDYATLNYAATLDVMPECCPYCAHSSLYRHSTEYSVHVLPSTNGYHQVLHLDKKRYKCNGCARTVVAQSHDLRDNSKITRPLLLQILDLARFDISAKLISYILKLSHTKIHKLLNATADRYRPNYEQQLPPVICIDEVQYMKNRYGFEMINGSNSDFIEIFPERTNAKVRGYLANFSLKNRKCVKLVVTDMNANYQNCCPAMFPNAQVVIDRFHTVQLAMKAVQSVRTGYQNTVDNRTRIYKILKSNWKLFLTNESKYDIFASRWFKGINQYAFTIDILDEVYTQCPNLGIACEIYQLILRAVNSRKEDEFVALLKNYKTTGTPMDTVIKTYKKYRRGIIESFRVKASNGRIEGINRRIKQMKRTAYGYAKPANFFHRIRLQLLNKHVLTSQFTKLMTE
ncbi:ISL3 family transposase [Periweissella cryptocerci]|uniref:ISL3 family transposase n=1 Tax=Periweissella cryptocerci TaxID=2506420 RepID=A0A4P6YRC8_9LACO|nr:ISL3 family transposase [Periweissella cryptocerci]QBO35199.1 ISL3 family transposase [Periweissella cryptocerci]